MNPDTLITPPSTTDAGANTPTTDDEPTVTPENQAAYESLASELAAAQPSTVKSLNLKVAATRAFKLHEEINKPDAAELVADISPVLFKRHNLALLVTAANAASYAYAMLKDAKALKDDDQTKLPPELVKAAKAHRKHMLNVAEYNLAHLSDASKILTDIRSGQGYIDLATDLTRLASLYEAYKSILKKDQTKYNPADAQRALDLDSQITQLLEQTKQGRITLWTNQSARVATVLRTVYEDVAETGRWVLRHLPEETLAERFPSLFVGKGGGRPPKS
jgi:hypothetical protein